MSDMQNDVSITPEAQQESWEASLSQAEAIQYARNWIETARMHAKNEAYWRSRALKAEGIDEAEYDHVDGH